LWKDPEIAGVALGFFVPDGSTFLGVREREQHLNKSRVEQRALLFLKKRRGVDL